MHRFQEANIHDSVPSLEIKTGVPDPLRRLRRKRAECVIVNDSKEKGKLKFVGNKNI